MIAGSESIKIRTKCLTINYYWYEKNSAGIKNDIKYLRGYFFFVYGNETTMS